MMLDISILKL